MPCRAAQVLKALSARMVEFGRPTEALAVSRNNSRS